MNGCFAMKFKDLHTHTLGSAEKGVLLTNTWTETGAYCALMPSGGRNTAHCTHNNMASLPNLLFL